MITRNYLASVATLLLLLLGNTTTNAFSVSPMNGRYNSVSSVRANTVQPLQYASDPAAIYDERRISSSNVNVATKEEDQQDSALLSELLSSEIARQFSAARRYALAAGVVKAATATEAFYIGNEEQRIRAVQLIECAREHGIELINYNDQIVKAKKSCDFLESLLVREANDSQAFQQLVATVQESCKPELVASLQAIQQSRNDWTNQMTDLLSPAAAAAAETVVDTATVATDSSMDFLQQQFNDQTTGTEGSFAPLDQVLSLGDAASYAAPTTSSTTPDEQLSMLTNQIQGSLVRNVQSNPALTQAGQHATPTGYIGAAVDSDYEALSDVLPSTETILDALPAADELLNSLPAPEDIFSAVTDGSAVGDFVDALQTNLLDDEVLAQIAEIVSGIY